MDNGKKSKKKLKKGRERAIKKITSEILIRTRARTPMAMADIEKGSPNKRGSMWKWKEVPKSKALDSTFIKHYRL